MWSDWLVFCDCGFHSICPLMEKDKRLTEASWWERLRKDWERLRAGGEGDDRDKTFGWHHQLNGNGLSKLGAGDGQGSLACCSPMGHKEWDTTEQLNWCWSSNTLATWCEEPTVKKRPWCWERLKAGGEEGNRGWDGWMASLTQWTWVWANRLWEMGKDREAWRAAAHGVAESQAWLRESTTATLCVCVHMCVLHLGVKKTVPWELKCSLLWATTFKSQPPSWRP